MRLLSQKINEKIGYALGQNLEILITAGFAEAEEASPIKEILSKAETKDSSYYEFYLK